MKEIIKEWKIFIDKKLHCIEREDRILDTLRLLKELFRENEIEVEKYYHEPSCSS